MRDAVSGLAAAVERAAGDLGDAVGGAAAGWVAAGVLLHLANQLARGRGWYAILRRACDADPRLRRRDALAAWVAGAGAGGVLSARGGDAVRVLLLSRRVPAAGCPVLAGTLVAEAAGDAIIGVAVFAVAVAAGAWPGLGVSWGATALWLAGAAVVAAAAGALLRRRPLRARPGWSRARRIAAGVGRGCAPLAQPGAYARHVMPWQLASRGLRAAALACFLLAFHLPAVPAAVLLVMLAQSGGRLLPLAPASVGAGVAVLAAGFGPATGSAAGAGELAGFLLGTSAVLTVVGVVLAVAVILCAAGPRALAGAVSAARTARRQRDVAGTVPAP